MTASETLSIAFTQQAKAYDIVIGEGLLANAGRMILGRLGLRRCVIVTDQNVAPFHLQKLEESLRKVGHTLLPSIAVTPGEASKSLPGMHELINNLFERMPDREMLIVALGGGVVGDMAGFASSILLRGLDIVQIPTSLLAQVDSSVGGKTGIDSLYGKNTVGTFHQPRLVISDTSTLETLPTREIKAGYAEAVKHGLIMDAEFFAWCEENAKALLKGAGPTRIHAVKTCCAIKAKVVAEDEREAGKRALLNLGHTFAHALESAMGYDGALLHGEAVAIGIVMAFALSAQLGLCPPKEAEAVHAHFEALGFALKPPLKDYDVDQLMALMAQDKKAQSGTLTLILARGIGDCFIAKDVNPAPIRSLWRSFL